MATQNIFGETVTYEADPRVKSGVIQFAWYAFAILAFLGAVIAGIDALSKESSIGVVFLIGSPFIALMPWTIGTALRRSARIERLLERADDRAARPDATAPESP